MVLQYEKLKYKIYELEEQENQTLNATSNSKMKKSIDFIDQKFDELDNHFATLEQTHFAKIKEFINYLQLFDDFIISTIKF